MIIFRHFAARKSMWMKVKICIIILYDNCLKENLGRIMLPLLQSIVPFDMGGNTVPHNGAKAQDTYYYSQGMETQNIKKYIKRNSENTIWRML